MSLKAFHCVFIVASSILSAGFGAWCVRYFTDTGSVPYLAMGILSFAAAVALGIYLSWFLRKTRKYGYLGLALALAVATHPRIASACAVCMGDPSSPLVKSANTGVLFLLAVIGAVLVGFGGLFLYWGKRARELECL